MSMFFSFSLRAAKVLTNNNQTFLCWKRKNIFRGISSSVKWLRSLEERTTDVVSQSEHADDPLLPKSSKTFHPSGIDFTHATKAQHADDPERSGFFDRVLARFPGGDGNRCLSFAYGSGVFRQANRSLEDGNMMDFVFVVEDSAEWHRQNLEVNPGDYSVLMRKLGSKLITDIQEKHGANMYFNTLIPFEEGRIKYGVISRSDLISDLLDWDALYAAGRLQKPVKIIEKKPKDVDQELHLALRMNLTSALHTSLLLLPDHFTHEELYVSLASLSYAGDFRMVVGEDRNKVKNIVVSSMAGFTQLYAKQLYKLRQFVHANEDGRSYEQDVSPSARHHHLTMLPKNVQLFLVDEWCSDQRSRDVEDVLRAAAFDRDSGEVIQVCVEKIVRYTSLSQAFKGFLTAGTRKTVIYSYSKLQKMFKSMVSRRLRDDYT